MTQVLANVANPRIERVTPSAAIPGGEVVIHGTGFGSANHSRPRVRFGEVNADVLFHADSYLIARVPDGASGGLRVATVIGESVPFNLSLGVQIADNLHPVTNPAVDHEGNIYVTFSGERGRRVPVSLYKVTSNFIVKPYVTQLINPSGLALDHTGVLYVSCRNDGTIYRVTPDGRAELFIEGMGIATGIAFDRDGNLFVGDRSGTIFKIGPDKQVFVFATLEPSFAFYHLAFSPSGELYVCGPSTSSFDRVYRISPGGQGETFYRGLGRPQGLAFDRAGNLYVVASISGRRGVVRITPEKDAELVLSGTDLVGLAMLSTRRAYLTTTGALFSLDWDVEGLALPV
jgi:sugar lactone lactonase YvrE